MQLGQVEADGAGVLSGATGHRDGEEFRCGRRCRARVANRERALPVGELLIVELAQIEHVALNDLVAGAPLVFDDAIVAAFLAIFLSRGVAQKHNGEA